jgi:hypothetical protein
MKHQLEAALRRRQIGPDSVVIATLVVACVVLAAVASSIVMVFFG